MCSGIDSAWNTFDAKPLTCGGLGIYTLAKDKIGNDFVVKINKIESQSAVIAEYIELNDMVGKHLAKVFNHGKVNKKVFNFLYYHNI